MSQLTTHILDTARGIPARGIHVKLYQMADKDWVFLTGGITNNDGRITDLLDTEFLLPHGLYKLHFDIKDYFDTGFYPYVEITFYIDSPAHYHVPLLLSPFGYSTYRGS